MFNIQQAFNHFIIHIEPAGNKLNDRWIVTMFLNHRACVTLRHAMKTTEYVQTVFSNLNTKLTDMSVDTELILGGVTNLHGLPVTYAGRGYI